MSSAQSDDHHHQQHNDAVAASTLDIHPLFLDTLPPHFNQHAGLSAIAALMDDDEDENESTLINSGNSSNSNVSSNVPSSTSTALRVTSDYDASSSAVSDRKLRSKRQVRKQQAHPYTRSTNRSSLSASEHPSQRQHTNRVPRVRLLDKTSYSKTKRKQQNEENAHSNGQLKVENPSITMREDDERSDKLHSDAEEKTVQDSTSTNEATLFLKLWKI